MFGIPKAFEKKRADEVILVIALALHISRPRSEVKYPSRNDLCIPHFKTNLNKNQRKAYHRSTKTGETTRNLTTASTIAFKIYNSILHFWFHDLSIWPLTTLNIFETLIFARCRYHSAVHRRGDVRFPRILYAEIRLAWWAIWLSTLYHWWAITR